MEIIAPLLQRGAQFEMSGSPYEVTAIKNDELRLSPMNGGAIAHLKFKALASLMASDQIQIKYLPQDVEDNRLTSLRGLSESQVLMFNRKVHYVRGVVSHLPDNPCAQNKIRPLLGTIASEINDQNPPGPSTVASWIHKWIKRGRNYCSLLPSNKPSRKSYLEFDPTVLEIINSSIEQIYLSKHRNSAKAVYSNIVLRIANYNADAAQPIVAPSEYLVGQFIKRIDAYERDLKRYGKGHATRRHRGVGRSILATRPLELCMADGQHMDVMVVNDTSDGRPRKVLGRPFITVILDVRTRCILAAFISLQPFCGGTVLKAMTEAVVKDKDRPRGIMSTLIVDNGCDYRDSGFMGFLASINVVLEICGPRMPNGKAHLERFFRTLNEDLIHKLPGTTFSNPIERGEYRSQDLACLTLADLRSRVQTWIDEIYHRRTHRTLGRAPIAVWDEETC